MNRPNDNTIDTWLDLWEEAKSQTPDLSIDGFIQQYRAELTAEMLVELKQKIAAIEEIDQVLQGRVNESDQTARSPVANRPSIKLVAGMEPIRGYVLQYQLGAGGSGQVWKVVGPNGFEMAMKFISLQSQSIDTETRSISITKEIKHPFILETYGAWYRYGFLIIAMELADCSLFDRLQECLANSESGIPRDELWRYMRQAAAAIDYLNSEQANRDSGKGIQHRDIKPQNLLLSGSDLRVADFGVAREIENTVTSHSGRLSVNYAAPEFFKGRTTATSDQYSLAVTYTYLRTGFLPFSGNEVQIFRAHLYQPPDLDLLPPIERAVVAKALSKNPLKRWESCSEFVQTLTDDSGNGAESLTQRQRRPWFQGAAVAMGLLLLVGAILTWRGRLMGGVPAFFSTSRDTGRVVPASEGSATGPLDANHTTEANGHVYDVAVSSPPQRALIGMRLWEGRYGVGFRSSAVGGLQAIYATANGEEVSPGMGYCIGEPVWIVAEPGYLITQIELRWTNDRIGGLRMVFGRLRDSGIDTDDSYSVEYQRRSVLDAGIDHTDLLGEPGQPITGLLARAPNQELTTLEITSADLRWTAGIRDFINRHDLNVGYGVGVSGADEFGVLPLTDTMRRLDVAEAVSLPAAIAEQFGLPVQIEHESGLRFRLLPALDSLGQPLGYLSTTEVSIGTFRKFVTESSYRTQAETKDAGGEGCEESLERIFTGANWSWQSTGFAQSNDHPVVNVSFRDATEFCKWMNGSGEVMFRLPNTQEWMAALDPSQQAALVADSDWDDDSVWNGNFRGARVDSSDGANMTSVDTFVFTAPGGFLTANDFGYADLLGNVREWTQTSRQSAKTPTSWSFNQRHVLGGSFLQRGTVDARRGTRDAEGGFSRYQGNPPMANVEDSATELDWLNDWDRRIDVGFRVFMEIPGAGGEPPPK